MKDTITLFKNFLKNPKEIGAVSPSSSYLCQEMLSKIDFKNSKTIVELGPGLGIFTKGILKKSQKDTKVICFEINKKFCSHLSKRFQDKKFFLINSGADKLEEELLKINVKKANCIVSGLPFRNFTKSEQKKVISQISSSLDPNGIFVLFQYTNGLRPMLEKHFYEVNRTFVTFNIPPAFVYTCRKPK